MFSARFKRAENIASLAPFTMVHELYSMGPAFSFQKCVQSSNRDCENPEVIQDIYSVFCTCLHHQNLVVVVVSPYKPNFGSAVADVPISNWKLDMAPGWRCSQLDSKKQAENIASLAPFTMVHQLYSMGPAFPFQKCVQSSNRTQKLYKTSTVSFAPASTIRTS